MKSLLTVFKWLGIFCAVILGLALICVVYLFIFPKSNILGVRLMSIGYQGDIIADNFDTTSRQVDKLVINAHEYDILLKPGKVYSEGYAFHTTTQVTGFALKKDGEIRHELIYDELINTLTVNLLEPRGVYIRTECYMIVYIPTNAYVSNVQYDLNTTAGDMYVGYNDSNKSSSTISDNVIKANDLTLTTTSGKINMGKVHLSGLMDLVLSKGRLSNTNHVLYETSGINIKVSSGIIDMATTEGINAGTYGTVSIQSSGDSSTIFSTIEDLKYRGGYGQIKIDTCSSIDVEAKSCTVKIKKLKNNSRIKLSEYGNINISESLGVADISTGSGNIVIEDATGMLILDSKKGSINVKKSDSSSIMAMSTSGNIVINEAKRYVDVSTKSGNITLSYADTASAYTEAGGHRKALLSTISGNIYADGVEYIKAQIENNGSGNIDITFHNVADKESTIVTRSGNARVVTHSGTVGKRPFILKTNSTGNTDIKVGAGVQYNGSGSNTFFAYGAEPTSVNIININSTNGGKIIVRDVSNV